jgi:DNA topoisomerase IB
MEFVLASIPAIQVESLIKLLTAACAVVSNGETNKELKTLATSVASGAKRAESMMSVDVVSTLIRIVKGEEVDHDELKARMKELRAGVREEIKTDTKFSHTTIDFLKCTTAYLINNGEPAIRKLRTLVNETGDKAFIKVLTPEPKSQKDFIKPLEKIVQAVGKRKGTQLTKEEMQKLKAKNRDVFREYKRLRTAYNAVWRDELVAFVNKSGKKAVPYKDIYNYLNSKKIDNPLTPGFDGLMDANGKIYTKAGKAILGSIPTKDSGFVIRMNPDYDPKEDNEFVYNTVRVSDDKVSQHVYTKSYRKGANEVKFAAVQALMKKINMIQKTWLPLLRRHDFSRACVAATVLQTVWAFGARLGTKGNATQTTRGRVSTYGIATLERRHVKIDGNTVTLQYPGKDAVRQIHVINGGASQEAKFMASNIIMFCKNKQPNDKVFQYEDDRGRLHAISGGELRGIFRKLGAPAKSTPHKVRHVKGTQLFMDLVAQHKKEMTPGSMTQAQGDKLFKEICTQVGALLGHVRGVGKQQKVTGATAMGNYIDPNVMIQFYKALDLRMPKNLEKIAKKGDE